MYRSLQYLSLFMIMVLLSCSHPEKAGKLLNRLEKSDSCLADGKNTYEVYIPQRKPGAALPLLIILDPHGDGRFAIQKFKEAAGRYPAVVVASNYITNGFPRFDEAIQALVKDVQNKYEHGEQVYMAGFSGGARMALDYALHDAVDGLLLCGALAGAGRLEALDIPVFAISGTDDFNFVETAQYLFREQPIPANLKIELTDASHNWPDSLLLANAFGLLYLSVQQHLATPPPETKIKEYIKNQVRRIDGLKEHDDLLKATMIARNMATTEPFSNDRTFTGIFDDLKNSTKYREQLARLKTTLTLEMKARQQYIEAFSTKDSVWWENEIRALESKLTTETDPFKKAMYRRIQSFWGIACYSIGNQAKRGHDTETMNKVVTVYRLVEPDNPYVSYFDALTSFWNGNDKAALVLLNKAINAGFKDMELMQKDFPDSITSKLDL